MFKSINLLLISILLPMSVSMSVMAQEVSEAKIKVPMPGMKMTAAYLKIKNNTDSILTLEKVSGEVAGHFELHTHKNEAGVMKMRKLENIAIPSGETHVLKPKHDHIMIFKVKEDLKENSDIPLTLHFKERGPLTVKFKSYSLKGN